MWYFARQAVIFFFAVGLQVKSTEACLQSTAGPLTDVSLTQHGNQSSLAGGVLKDEGQIQPVLSYPHPRH